MNTTQAFDILCDHARASAEHSLALDEDSHHSVDVEDAIDIASKPIASAPDLLKALEKSKILLELNGVETLGEKALFEIITAAIHNATTDD